jgi:hypothetical protein
MSLLGRLTSARGLLELIWSEELIDAVERTDTPEFAAKARELFTEQPDAP